MLSRGLYIIVIMFAALSVGANGVCPSWLCAVFAQESKEDKIAALEAKINEMQVRYEEQINKILEQYSETQQQLEKALKMIEELKKESVGAIHELPEKRVVVEEAQPLEEKTKGIFDISEFLEEKKVGPVEWHGRLEGRYIQTGSTRNIDNNKLSTFEQSTFALWAGIDITKNIEVISELEFEPAGGEEQKIRLDLARLTWDLIKLPTSHPKDGGSSTSTLRPEYAVPWGIIEKGILSFTFGKFYYPFGIERFSYSGPVNKLVDRPSPFRQIIPGTYSDVGAKIHGIVPIYQEVALRYEAALTNGLAGPLRSPIREDRQNTDNNRNKQVGGRLGLSLTDWLEIGSSAITGKYDSDNSQDMNFIGADARITYDKIKLLSSTTEEVFDLRGEYVFNHVNQPSAKKRDLDFIRDGWYIQTAYKFEFHKPFLNYIEPVFRYDSLNDDVTKFASTFTPLGQYTPNKAMRKFKPVLEVNRYAFGIGWSPFKHFRIKGEYEISDEQDIPEVNNNAILYEMTIDW